MIIDLTQQILDLSGQPMRDENDEPAILKNIVKTALMSTIKGDENASADEKINRTILAKDAYTSEQVDWKSEDVTLIKKRINSLYANPLVVSEAYRLIEGDK